SEGVRLKIADTQHTVLSTEKWYRIATNDKLAIGIIHYGSGESEYAIGTGFLVRGESLSQRWQGSVVFLTARHVLHAHDDEKPPGQLKDYSVTFPGVDKREVKFDKILLQSEQPDFAVLSISDKPGNATTITLAA